MGVLRCGGPVDAFARRIERFLRADGAESAERCDGGRSRAAPASRCARSASATPDTRWGSCSASGAIRYSWRLILAPPHLLRWFVAHEVAHRRHMNHGARVQGARGGALRRLTSRSARAELRALGPRLKRVGRGGSDGGAAAGSRGGSCCGLLRLRPAAAADFPDCGAAPRPAIAGRPVPRLRLRRQRIRRLAVPIGLPSASTSGSESTVFMPQASSSGSSCQSGIGTSVSNCSTGRLATATFMKSWKARAGAVPPCRPATALGIVAAHPHAGRQPARKADEPAVLVGLVVPVLPATGRPIWAARPVPVSTADCSRSVIPAATHGATSTRSSALVLVEQPPVGGDDLADRIGHDADAAILDRGEGAGHVDQAHVAGPQHHRGIGRDFAAESRSAAPCRRSSRSRVASPILALIVLIDRANASRRVTGPR